MSTASVIELLLAEGWDHRSVGRDDLVDGPTATYLLTSKIVPGHVAVEGGALTARLQDDDETVVRYGGLRGRLLAEAARLGRRTRVHPVVVVWGELAGGVVEDEGVTYVRGDELASWLRETAHALLLAS